MNVQKPAFWIVLLAAAVCIALTGCYTAKPALPEDPSSWPALEDIQENYSREQAEQDGCVVIDNSDLVSGEKIWVDFVNQANSGSETAVRIYQSYSNQDNSYFVKELRYDGERYLLRFYDRTGDTEEEFLFVEEYRYMNRCMYTPDSQAENLMEYYLLADSPDVTAEGYLQHLFSSVAHSKQNIYNHCHCIYSCGIDYENVMGASQGVAFSDIDDDGVEEKCCLGFGPTSGIFTFTLNVYQNNDLEYECMYCTEFYYLSFVQDKNGKLQIQGITQGDSPETHLFDLVIENQAISLVEGDTTILPG